MKPPTAKRIQYEITVHGHARADEYYWLRNRDDPDVLAYLKAENEYTEAFMKPTGELQNALYDELVARIKETDSSVPCKHGDYFYYSRTEEGKQYAIHCRKRGDLDADEQILLDENRLAGGKKYFSIGAFKVSPDHRLLAYSVDFDGSEKFVVYFKDLSTGGLLDETIPDTYYGLEWANDARTVFYNVLDDKMRPHKLFRHRVGTSAAADELVHHERDDAYFLELYKTRSQRFIMMRLASNTTTEVQFLDADKPWDSFRRIHPRQHKMEYHVTHHGDFFYIITNDNAKNFKLVRAPVDRPSKRNWKNVIRHRKDVKIDDVDAFRNYLVVYERKKGLKTIRIMDPAAGGSHYLKFSEPAYTLWVDENPEFDTDVLRFTYTSLVTPRSVFDYDMGTRTMDLKKRYQVLGGYDTAGYTTERVFATAKDGARIPISMVYKKGLARDGKNPTLLYGYGAYGASYEPFFLSHRVSLLDRGFIFAIAHVRGGGEMGRHWYEQGKLLNKKNTFTDFIACAEYMIKKRYTSNERIVISGGSAGGLLMGAMLNMRPDLFRCVVAHVPFVDVVTTMLDKSIPLTVVEFEEWGNPESKRDYEYMLSYSPYDNVKRGDIPNMLVTAGLNDPRVQYWEPAKWVARLRTMNTNESVLLLRTKLREGHSGASGRYDYLRDVAFEYAFVLRCFGLSQ